ncbi:MAG: peroxiredoxin family protein [Chloroflexia bacterium]
MGVPAAGGPQIKQGRMVPLFTLPSTAGGLSGPGALRSKYNMVLGFVGSDGGARSYLRALAEVYPSVLEEQARVIAVVVASSEEARELAGEPALPFTVLADEGGAVTRRMLGEGAGTGLCVADRYGEAYYVEAVPSVEQLPLPQTAVDWLQFIGIQCPE